MDAAASQITVHLRVPVLDKNQSQEVRRRAAQIYFPTVYDIKYLMKFCDNLHGGLNKLAEVLDVDRIGPQHQARLLAPLPALTPPPSAACRLRSPSRSACTGSACGL